MEVTVFTFVVALAGLVIMGLLYALEFIAVLRPRSEWTVKNVYSSDPGRTDSKAYFAFNQGLAWADVIFWGPVQIAGCVGMLLGERWGFLLGLAGSIPFIYTAITIFIWDRDLGYRQNSFVYWAIIWGMFPAFGIVEAVYCFARLVA